MCVRRCKGVTQKHEKPIRLHTCWKGQMFNTNIRTANKIITKKLIVNGRNIGVKRCKDVPKT